MTMFPIERTERWMGELSAGRLALEGAQIARRRIQVVKIGLCSVCGVLGEAGLGMLVDHLQLMLDTIRDTSSSSHQCWWKRRSFQSTESGPTT